MPIRWSARATTRPPSAPHWWLPGSSRIELETVPNLARAWGHRLPTFALGAIGDLLTLGIPSRRSTIVAVARKP